ncbi:MAG: suppressor of fused domain protein, partial [Vicinamibacteria bacterium]
MNRSCFSPRSRRPQGGAPTTASAIQLADSIAAHVERNVGPIDFTFTLHEMEDHPVRVDVHHVPPADHRPFHTLVTSGMSRVELFMLLPPGFSLSAPSIEEGRWSWPLGVVRGLARDPRDESTWLGWGHLVL